MSRAGLLFHIGLNATRASAAGWGDTPYAEALIRALERAGHGGRLFFRGETPQLRGQRDVVLRIIGPHLDHVVPGVPNMLWMISPPNGAPLASLCRYQRLWFASPVLAQDYARMGLPAAFMPQATDTGMFHPDRAGAGGPRYGVVFVGNLAARAPRANIRRALAAGVRVDVWGQGWQGVVPDDLYHGPRLSLEELAEVYARADCVINSHMPQMAAMGFMSNRSHDAMASGAVVMSDVVAGWEGADLPDLHMPPTQDAFEAALRRIAEAPRRSRAARRASAGAVAGLHDFDARAAAFIAAAEELLAEGTSARAIYARQPAAPTQGKPQSVTLSDLPAQDDDPGEDQRLIIDLDRALEAGPLRVDLRLHDPTAPVQGARVDRAMVQAARRVARIGAVLARRDRLAGLRVTAPESDSGAGVIHPMLTDLRQAHALALSLSGDATAPPGKTGAAATDQSLARLCDRAARILGAGFDPRHPLSLAMIGQDRVQYLIRVMNNRPLHHHAPEVFDRAKDKRHLVLWPRKAAPDLARPIGVFVHLFHAELAAPFARRLAVLPAAHRLYVSTDTEAKADAIRAALPDAEIRVLPNRGRDIWPKLYGFGDAHADHDIVLHLHGKKSPHSGRLDDWLSVILDCLLPDAGGVNRIVSLFDAVPALGIVAPMTYRAVLGAAHWGDNREIAQELARRLRLDTPLPGDNDLQFPVGSMFWARSATVRPLIDLALEPGHFPPEGGQVDGTLAHAMERMFGVICQSRGQKLLRVAPQGSNAHKAFQLQCRNNGELRRAIEAGFCDG